MIKDLIKVANSLDSKGFTKEADELDLIIRKLAQMGGAVESNYSVLTGENMRKITEKHSKIVGKTVEDNLALNPSLKQDPDAMIKPGLVITIWTDPAYEGGVRNP